jgi:leader peptidase (prepilin peptidase)/N-methyltransferase
MSVFLEFPALAITFAVLVGACVGSFLNVCISRWPLHMSVVSPPSRCPTCERPIRAYENIPILGWIMLGGRCAGCRTRISVQYPLVELLIAAVWGLACWHYGWTFTALRVAVFVTVLAGIAITDAKHYLIPDGFTVFGLGWVLVTMFIALFVPTPSFVSPFAAPYDALIGACTGAGAIAIAGWLGEVALGREAMGFGDVTLMAVAGGALGPNRTLLTIFLAAALGMVIFLLFVYPIVKVRAMRRGQPMELPLVPFGVFLAPAAVVALLVGTPMIQWYVSRFLGL